MENRKKEANTQRIAQSTFASVAEKRHHSSTAKLFSLQRYQQAWRESGGGEENLLQTRDMRLNSLGEDQKRLESTMSATMIDFVNQYGIQVQPAKRDQSPHVLHDGSLEILHPPEHYHTRVRTKARPQTSNFNGRTKMYRSSFAKDTQRTQALADSKYVTQPQSQAVLSSPTRDYHEKSTRRTKGQKSVDKLLPKKDEGVIQSIMRSTAGYRTAKSSIKSAYAKGETNSTAPESRTVRLPSRATTAVKR